MREAFTRNNLMLLLFSLLSLYLLAPSLDRRQGVLVSLGFALILILSSHVENDRKHWLRYVVYLLISVGTYFILFNDEPWNFLFHGGMFESSAVPLVGCSIIMTLAGWLLLASKKERMIYTMVTLGIQIPIGFIVGADGSQGLLNAIAKMLHYQNGYAVSWQVWQFEWMVTYYLPVYFLRHRG